MNFWSKKDKKADMLWDQKCILEKQSALSLSIDDHQSRRAERVLILVSLLTFLFVMAELIGGYLAHSLAVVTDAFHMLSDLSSFVVSILALRLARRPATKRHSYGFQRAEVLGALSSILVIWMLTGVLLYLAILRIIEHEYEVEPNTMMITASIGVFFNLLIGAMLHLVWRSAGDKVMHAHGHSHAHSSKAEIVAVEEGHSPSPSVDHHHHHHHHHDNLNIRAAFVHVLGDLVQSLGVLVAAVIIKYTGASIADPICTFMFSILVLLTTVPVFGDTLTILMEASPRQVNHQKLYSDLCALPGVIGVHSLRVWALKTDTFAATVHLEMGGDSSSSSDVVAMAQQMMTLRHRIRFVTVQTHCLMKNAEERTTKLDKAVILESEEKMEAERNATASTVVEQI